MGYRIFSLRGGSSDVREFDEAMEMAKEGLARVCELAEEMRDQYGDRRGSYGNRSSYRGGGSSGGRGGFGERERERGGYGDRDMWDDDEMMMERRRRDSRGRYM